MFWLNLFSQFDMIIHYIPGKSNVIFDALPCHYNLSAVVGLVESDLLAWICEA